MASPSLIIARSASAAPPLHDPGAAHWLSVLRAHFELVRAELRAELRSNHPGARHRVATLLSVAANLDGQIQAAEVGRA